MAPEGAKARRTRENQYIFDLGVRGRKTGLTLPDTGLRDENGLEPLDGLFSSPEKPARSKSVNGHGRNRDADLSSDDMDIGEIPEPNEVINARASIRRPPRSKSPIKTHLKSPARRHPSLAHSSPIRETARTIQTMSVRRKLDFENSMNENGHESPAVRASPLKKASATAKAASGKLRLAPIIRAFSPQDEEEEVEEEPEGTPETHDEPVIGDEDDDFQLVSGGDDIEVDEEIESEEAEGQLEPGLILAEKSSKKSRGKTKSIEPESEQDQEEEAEVDVAPPKMRGRKRKAILAEPEVEEPAVKKGRRSLDKPTAANPKGKASAVGKSASTTKIIKPKGVSKKQKKVPVSETLSPEVHRGPPLPRSNRGLIILRRETPSQGSGFQTTRSGRNSIRPVAYWKNERIEFDADEEEDGSNGKFLLPRIKGVVRAEEIVEDRPKKGYRRPSKGKKRSVPEPILEEEDESEPWEVEPGRVMGDIREWNAEDQNGDEDEEREEEIALSAAAIITRDVGSGANFKFAKTISKPFFGAGMVDLPPGGIKKPKSTRKMQMVFFVFYGRVEVRVNDTAFSIGKGGMWQVPRGNFYSIQNDTDKEARIFFAQGCDLGETSEGQ
ncbi:Mif2/CENP-C like-domain-containing protein [Bisporella sp. PMI_857]|nr:Mif2/CENP-C like-domain-containing protein [Bisporella sp. PMI_857]